jgi:hypothetical protein
MVETIGGDPRGARRVTEPESFRPADVVYRLSGYLTGTHRGRHLGRSNTQFGPAAVVRAFRNYVPNSDGGVPLSLGTERWEPLEAYEQRLCSSLRERLAVPGVVDLVLFGSLARGTTTGFSDVDAILVIDDWVAADTASLDTLRPTVLAAGRAVLAYQPLQHHGFLVTTPRLLESGSASMGLPGEALATTASLFGRTIETTWNRSPVGVDALAKALNSLATTASWPENAWFLHRLIATYELVPVLYLQAVGRSCPKSASFGIARTGFAEDWTPFDVLEEVRNRWPRARSRELELLALSFRNPWIASAVRRRFPIPVASEIAELLDARVIDDLRRLVALMARRARAAP